MLVMVTGGLGFIGSYLVKHILDHTTWDVINVDIATYASTGPSRFSTITPTKRLETRNKYYPSGKNKRHKWLQEDVRDRRRMLQLIEQYRPQAVFHLAAETHVDRSIQDASLFVQTNVEGTLNILDGCLLAAERNTDFVLVYMSTDEVYGPVPPVGDLGRYTADPALGGFREEHRVAPRNAYAASKTAAEHLVQSYIHTHRLPVVISRHCNAFGPWQHPEKFLPKMALRAANNLPLPIYGDGDQRREWMHAEDHASALVFLAQTGERGQVYNVGSGEIRTNRQVAQFVCQQLRRSATLLTPVPDRLGHDRHYELDSRKLAELGWFRTQPPLLTAGLKELCEWYAGDGWSWASRHVSDDILPEPQEEAC